MKITNYSVQQDLYQILNLDKKNISIILKGKNKSLNTTLEDGSIISYSYDNKDNLESDYKTIRKVINKLK